MADLVDHIQSKEVVRLLSNGDKGVPSMQIPSFEWWSEGLHGVALSPGVTFADPTPYASSFPQVVTTSASFNVSLFKALGSAISTEARAFANVGNAGLTYWTPNINIFRDPRWGRGQETPGEDPTLNAQYAVNFVQGMQEGEDPLHLKTSACLKHYSAYSLEGGKYDGGVTRHTFNAVVTKQDQADTYFPAFQAGVQQGRASSLMCSYNAVNGVPSCADPVLLQGQVRGQWGFDGYITSDCGAVLDVQESHKYIRDAKQVCKAVLQAGMDSDCALIGNISFFNVHLQAAIDTGVVKEQDYKTALSNLFRVRMRLGEFDPVVNQPYLQYGVDRINTPEHQQLALEAARQGMVLLKNEGNVLPLPVKVKTLALIGPNADSKVALQANYFGIAPYLVSVKEGLEKYGKVDYVSGCDLTECPAAAGFQAAVSAAATADVTVLVMGIGQKEEREGHDRRNITLPGLQQQLIDEVSAAAKGDVILVVMSGGALDLSQVKSSPNIKAILFVGYPGQSGGDAVAQTLYGDNRPAGRLTQTFYPAIFTSQCSIEDLHMRPNLTTGCTGRTHRFYTGHPVFPFGFGLSYTTWQYSLSLSNERIFAPRMLDPSSSLTSLEPALTVATVQLQNTGARASDHVVLLFTVPPPEAQKTQGAPRQILAGFHRFSGVQPGASVSADIPIRILALASATEDGLMTTHRGKWKVVVESEELSLSVL